ncbi:OVARIAN TUMOR DOMAIN-containing deubiquitinating enzyme 12-like [Zea mays]|uniref:OVARIAN TUMOR DOMAIN-containing deubiquitinating enzyme 12-like n=1 Tax=Zea mays TaxID=4577 RepID=UPI0004DE8165|nr:OVARIAN TUMOR DOMAIN-containing deubiquitinating enzyme 12-like [Zea mays]
MVFAHWHLRLNAYSLFEVRVSGDGNCQLKECNSLYEGYVPMKYKHYCKKMKKYGEWGDHVTLQAAADKINSLFMLCF